VPDPQFVDFKPRWMREPSGSDRILEDTPATGSPAEVAPRINTRILPLDGGHRISAKTLGDAIELTQAIVQYAGYDVYHGINPDFADLRSLSADLVELTKLSVEPFEEGSFVIPARLGAAPLEVPEAGRARRVGAEEVVARFDEMLATFRGPGPAAQVSIGALQAIESLGRVIRREAQGVEFDSFDGFGRLRQSIRVDVPYVQRVQDVLASRRPSQARVETLEGVVTALDLVGQRLRLSLQPSGRRVRGTFSMLFQPTLVERFGRNVRLQGLVERRGNHPVAIQVLSVEVPDEE
jgi:hypothetical protein